MKKKWIRKMAMVFAIVLGLGPTAAWSEGFSLGASKYLVLNRWERYPGLLDEEALAARASAATVVAVPFASPLFSLNTPTAPDGSSTYRVTVGIKTEPVSYGLYLPHTEDYASVRANGVLVYKKGQEAATASLLHFTATGPTLSLVLQSDAAGPRLEDPGCLPRLILFGRESAIQSFYLESSGTVLLIAGFFILTALFTLVLFLFWRKNVDFLALASFLFASALYTLAKTGSFIGFIGLQTRETYVLLILASSLLLSALAFLYCASFPGSFPRPARLAAMAAPGAFIIAALVLPQAGRIILVVLAIYAALLVLGLCAKLTMDAIKGNRLAPWFLPALAAAFIAFLCRGLFRSSPIAAAFLEPAGLLVFAFLSLLMLVKKVGDSFESSETLTDYVANVTTTMKRFIPSEFLECLNKEDVMDLKLGDHVKKEMTIFFSDIRAFTELSEKLTVEENFAFINSYLSRMVPILTENGGFVDKYIGDGIMALFAGEGGPDAAIRAAISMQSKMVEYNGHRAKVGYRHIGMGVGIHTGDLMLGVIGVDNRMENTVISDAVNLASRLQSITKAFNISLAISEQAFKELEDPGVYKYRFIGKVKVKGKAAPVSVFEIFDGIAPDLFERKMKANTYFEQGMLSYYQKDFGGAMYYFKRVLEIIPEDGAAAFYLENCINKATI
jgi:class 3 adenylate cyclase